MKKKNIIFHPTFLLFIIALSFVVAFKSKQKEPWTASQLMDPKDLAFILNNPKAHQPIVLSIGPGAIIKNSVDIGSASEARNMDSFKKYVTSLSKDETIVVYCGCCPFDKCPNIRPAFEVLNQMGFRNHKMLNLSRNIKADWIDRHYPVAE